MRALLLGLMLFTGCTLQSGYVTADRMTFDAIAPEYRLYVAEDDTLSHEKKERRYRLVESWDARSSDVAPVGSKTP